jgi:hypothetical protein
MLLCQTSASLLTVGWLHSETDTSYSVIELLHFFLLTQDFVKATLSITLLHIMTSAVLAGLRLPSGKTTVMHLVAREHLPEPNSQSNY